MSADSGRRPVLATLSAAQIPHIGPTPAALGLAAGIEAALRLALDHGPTSEYLFAAALLSVRSDATLGADYSSSWAAGVTLIREALASLPAALPIVSIR